MALARCWHNCDRCARFITKQGSTHVILILVCLQKIFDWVDHRVNYRVQIASDTATELFNLRKTVD